MKGYLFEFLLIINEFPVTTKRTLYTKMMKSPRPAANVIFVMGVSTPWFLIADQDLKIITPCLNRI